jgi:hypothetical protein
MRLLLALLLVSVLSAPVSLSVEGGNAFAPAEVRLHIHVPLDPDHRTLLVEWDSDRGDAGSTGLSLVDTQQTSFTINLHHLSAGYYTALATVHSADDKDRSVQANFKVVE